MLIEKYINSYPEKRRQTVLDRFEKFIIDNDGLMKRIYERKNVALRDFL